ncbi:hypothetical protein B1F74_12810 [Pseudomonas syringae]|nr:hypothetical protein B1F74_12810 [Pseudomonas syringae]
MFAKGAAARHLSFLTLQRGDACRDAPRHRSAPSHIFRTGRRASRTACPRGAVLNHQPTKKAP